MSRRPKRNRKPLTPEQMRARRLVRLRRDFVSGRKLTKLDENLLRQEHPKLFEVQNQVQVCNTLESVALFLSDAFKRDVRKQYIDHWLNGKDLSAGTPPFPARDLKTKSFDTTRCKEWYQKYKMPNGAEPTLEQTNLFESDRVDKMRREQERRDFERFKEDKERGLYVLLSDVIGYAAGSARQLAMHYDKLIEDKDGLRAAVQAAATELALADEQRLKLDVLVAASFLTANSGLKSRFKKLAAETQERIEALKEGK